MVKYKFSVKIGNEKLTPKCIYYQGNIGVVIMRLNHKFIEIILKMNTLVID